MDFDKFQQETNIHLRHFRDEDAPALVEFIREEYGETYPHRKLYNPQNIIDQNHSGANNFMVAELGNGKVVGMVALTLEPSHSGGGKMYELTSGIVLKEYRRHGIIYGLFKYAIEELRKMPNVSALSCRAMMYNAVVQELLEEVGLVPCGYKLSALLITKIQHSYERDDNIKYPNGILAMKVEKQDAGTIYIPQKHSAFTRDIYNSIGVKFNIDNSKQDLRGESLIDVAYDSNQQDGNIRVDVAGEDLIARVTDIQNSYTDVYKTFNIFLNVNHPAAVTAYEKLRTLGYFFSGFKPLSNGGELMIMHNPCNVPIIFDTWKLSPKFEKLREYVESCYNNRGA